MWVVGWGEVAALIHQHVGGGVGRGGGSNTPTRGWWGGGAEAGLIHQHEKMMLMEIMMRCFH